MCLEHSSSLAKGRACFLWLIERGILHLERASYGLVVERPENEECYIWSAFILVYGWKNEEYYTLAQRSFRFLAEVKERGILHLQRACFGLC